MKNVLFFVCAIGVAGCGSSDTGLGLSGQPSWFPLGVEVYHENERFEAQRGLLEFQAEPRWFLGSLKAVTKDEFETFEKKQHVVTKETPVPQAGQAVEDMYQIPASPPYPKKIGDVPLEDQGATLHLDVANGDTPVELVFTLKLTAGDRAVRREVEHRWTNVLPFLFAFFADGKPVSRELHSFDKMRGANQLVDLVPADGQKVWRLRVATESIDAIVGADAKEVAIVAAFSERQHEGYFPGDIIARFEVWDLEHVAPQITIRSNVVRLMRSGRGWVVSGDR